MSGIEDKEVREQVQKLVEEKYSDRMYQYYTGIADSVGNLSSNTYQYATDVQEVRRYLKGVTGEDISLENLYLTPDGKIGGLPEKAANLINKTKDNAKIERIKDALINIIGHYRTSGGSGEFQTLLRSFNSVMVLFCGRQWFYGGYGGIG